MSELTIALGHYQGHEAAALLRKGRLEDLLIDTDRPRPGAVYNVCDDDPAPPEDVLAHAAHLLGLPPPPEESWDAAEMTPMARSFYAESKRVRNDRIKDELGVRLIHPDYRSGLAALLAEEGG